jgi:hypothetical protein
MQGHSDNATLLAARWESTVVPAEGLTTDFGARWREQISVAATTSMAPFGFWSARSLAPATTNHCPPTTDHCPQLGLEGMGPGGTMKLCRRRIFSNV